jgi:hypothetical protein
MPNSVTAATARGARRRIMCVPSKPTARRVGQRRGRLVGRDPAAHAGIG